MARHRLALTMGDPAGIGPEIVLKAADAVATRGPTEPPELVIVGAREPARADGERLGLPISGAAHRGRRASRPGAAVARCRVEGGRQAYHAVARSVELALAGEVDAIVTAPLNKAALNAAGLPLPRPYRAAGAT